MTDTRRKICTGNITQIRGVYSGRPLIRGAPVNIIQGRFRAGESKTSIAADFDLDAADVDEALACDFPEQMLV